MRNFLQNKNTTRLFNILSICFKTFLFHFTYLPMAAILAEHFKKYVPIFLQNSSRRVMSLLKKTENHSYKLVIFDLYTKNKYFFLI